MQTQTLGEGFDANYKTLIDFSEQKMKYPFSFIALFKDCNDLEEAKRNFRQKCMQRNEEQLQ